MPRRAATFAVGLRGESLAAWCLRLKGYRVLARRSKREVYAAALAQTRHPADGTG